jgi:acetyl-CoA C-acetyltransferase
MAHAIRRAADDAGLNSVPNPTSLRVVSLLSWRYGNAPRFVAEQLGLEPPDLAYTTNGGNSPQSLINATAAEIQRGSLDLAILTGGEAFRTRMRARKEGIALDWPKAADGDVPRTMGEDLVMNHPAEIARQIVMPVQVYPMFETVIRARAGRSIDDHRRHIATLWSRFSDVSTTNPYAWSQRAYTPDEIATPSPTNRMIGLPYPKLMNSNNDVDMAAAVIICSAAKAEALGVSRDRWVFVHAGSDCHEHQFISERWQFDETPAIALGGRRALELAGFGIDEVEVVDLYSCFPAAVQLGAQSLGLSIDRQLTRTGGLSFAGGPWNNYVMHAVASVVSELRSRPGEPGLVWANGGYTTKHAFGVYATTPPAAGFRHTAPQDEIDALPRRTLAEPADAAGERTIEAYTVMHERDGSPQTAIVTTLLDDGRRAWGTSSDGDTVRALCDGEWVGQQVQLDAEGAMHL